MEECIKHYTTMFHPLIPTSNRTFYSPTSFTVPPSEPVLSISKVPSIHAVPLLSLPDETTLLDSGLLDQISPDKIKFQLSRMSTSSSSGTDGITVIMLRYLQDTSFTEHLYQLYTACLRKGETPQRWNQACMFPLCQDKKKPYTARNSRPITIFCLFRIIFESLIISTVRSSGQMTYSGIQGGFCSGYSTLTNVLTLHHLIESDAGSHIVFLDFASTFDSVNWPILCKELQKQGMNQLVLQLIYRLMYQDMSFSLIVNGAPSPQIPRTSGFPQGSCLSPTLFNRFIDSLLQTVKWHNPPSFPSPLFFADDGVLISPTLGKAQSLLNEASHLADQHGMAFKFAKCGYLITHTASKAPPAIRPSLQLHNLSIPFVQSYKYLGVTLSSLGINFVVQGNILRDRVARQLGAMRWFSNIWSPRIRLNIMKSILLPTLEYSLPLLFVQAQRSPRSRFWNQLNTAYNNCLKWIVGGNSHRPHVTGHLLRLLPFNHRAQYLHSRFYLHLMAMDYHNPLYSILQGKGWYPKSNHHILVHNYDPLLYQFLNPPPLFDKYYFIF